MKAFARIACLILVCAASALAQIDRYIVSHSVALAGTTKVVTIQQPATGAKRVEIESITVQCVGADCPVLIDRDGSAATTTAALIVTALNPETAPAAGRKFLAYTDSNAGIGVALSPTWTVPDKAIFPIPFTGTFKESSGTTKNINVRVGPATATANFQIVVREYR